MSEVAGDWLKQRLSDWNKRGHDTSALAVELEESPAGASERLLRAERTIEAAERLRERLEDMPSAWPERDKLLSRLRDPMNLQAVEREWLQLMRGRRPWHLLAHKVRDRWSQEGRTAQLDRWLERFDRLDESMIPEAQEAMLLLEHAATEQTLEVAITNLFDRQERRRTALEQMLEWLHERRGWGLHSISGTLAERFAAAEVLLGLDELLLQVQEAIDESVLPYDSAAAALLHERSELCQRMEDEPRLLSLLDQVAESGFAHIERLAAIQTEHDRLRSTGFHLEAPNPLQPGDLLAHEAGLAQLQNDVARLRRAWSALAPLAELFPEVGGELSALEGQVHLVDELESLLAEYSSRRDEREQEAHETLARWDEHEVQTGKWRRLLAEHPRQAWSAIREHEPRVRACADLLQTANGLDLSFKGEQEFEDWHSLLRNADVTAEDVELVQAGIQRRVVRNERHRKRLDEARSGLGENWPDELDASLLTLAEYEQVITELQAGETDAYDILESPLFGRRDMLLEHTQVELDLWASRGWDVARLQERLQRDANGLWLELADVRLAMERYDRLRPRLMALPLGRDAGLLDEVRRHCRRPERLQGLWEDIPAFAVRLAGLDALEEDHSFSLFVPSIPEPFTKLHPYAADAPVLWPSGYTRDVALTPSGAPAIVEEESEGTSSEEMIRVDSSEDALGAQRDEPVTEQPVSLGKQRDMEGESEVAATEPAEFAAPLERLLTALGTEMDSVESVYDQLQDAGDSDCDLRVARLCRLTAKLLLEPGGTRSAERLTRVAEKLQRWTALRLERRHATAEGGLIQSSARLASRLNDIPGPGTPLPRGPDTNPIPGANDKVGFEAAINQLEISADLPQAGARQASEATA